MNHPMGEPSQAPQEVLPLMRVKKLMKEEADVKAVAGDASYAAARATEFLIEELARRAFDITAKSNRDMISYSDIAMAVSEWPAAIFLQDIVPKRMPLSDLIKRLRDTEQPQNGSAQGPAIATANGNTAAPQQQAMPMQLDTEQPKAPVEAAMPQKPPMHSQPPMYSQAPMQSQPQMQPQAPMYSQPQMQPQYAGMLQQQQQQHMQPPPAPQGPIMQRLQQQQQQAFPQAPGLPMQQMGAPTYKA